MESIHNDDRRRKFLPSSIGTHTITHGTAFVSFGFFLFISSFNRILRQPTFEQYCKHLSKSKRMRHSFKVRQNIDRISLHGKYVLKRIIYNKKNALFLVKNNMFCPP